MRKFIFVLLFPVLLVHTVSRAQGNVSDDYQYGKDVLSRIMNKSGYTSSLNLSLDPFIEENYFKHLLYNSWRPDVMGYQIRIFSASGQDALERATRVRAEFLSRYEGTSVYLLYETPDYKVYVGDCRTRSEALKLFEEIKKDYPYAFLVDKAIQPKKE